MFPIAGDQKSAPLLFAMCSVHSTGTRQRPLLLRSFLELSSPFSPPSYQTTEVENLKALLEVKTQVSIQQQQLFYNGKKMRNAKKSSGLGVNDGDLMMIVSHAFSSSEEKICLAICNYSVCACRSLWSPFLFTDCNERVYKGFNMGTLLLQRNFSMLNRKDDKSTAVIIGNPCTSDFEIQITE
ncbi:Protein DNA-DAMAGE INDUCIBLE 1 [Camellia lanceoleosa]|uniref:Protein DNA-DAMAGE INDUCIBLE 1 n=1 Tax=Camellia lanceoleosa TaxID=1840588 RepID=A0ACC0IPD3_9ERIC|nr:Protein DNA-DAMAGE INDUCIBLE 1 [Camellia lanceoleosa]